MARTIAGNVAFRLTVFYAFYFLELFIDLPSSCRSTLRKGFIKMKSVFLLIFLKVVDRNISQPLQELKSQTSHSRSSFVMLASEYYSFLLSEEDVQDQKEQKLKRFKYELKNRNTVSRAVEKRITNGGP